MIRNRWEAIEIKYVCYLLMFFLIVGNGVSSGLAKDSFEYKEKEDVTGDGKEDVILIEQSENEKLLQLKIGGEKKFITVPLADGEDAKLSIVDMNEDGVKDILVTLQSDNNEEVNGFAYSFKNQQQKNLKTPPILNIHTKMLNHYKAEISILCKTHIVDISKYKKHYETEGIYKKGIVANSASLEVSDYIQLKPIITTSGKGIRGEQKIIEPGTGRSIGKIISAWFYKDDKWNLEDIEFDTPLKNTYHYLHID